VTLIIVNLFEPESVIISGSKSSPAPTCLHCIGHQLRHLSQPSFEDGYGGVIESLTQVQ